MTSKLCYIVFIRHSLHWRYIKIALRKYVINSFTDRHCTLTGIGIKSIDRLLKYTTYIKVIYINYIFHTGKNEHVAILNKIFTNWVTRSVLGNAKSLLYTKNF